MANSIKGIRTIALVGQAGSGKTSLAEALQGELALYDLGFPYHK